MHKRYLYIYGERYTCKNTHTLAHICSIYECVIYKHPSGFLLVLRCCYIIILAVVLATFTGITFLCFWNGLMQFVVLTSSISLCGVAERRRHGMHICARAEYRERIIALQSWRKLSNYFKLLLWSVIPKCIECYYDGNCHFTCIWYYESFRMTFTHIYKCNGKKMMNAAIYTISCASLFCYQKSYWTINFFPTPMFV